MVLTMLSRTKQDTTNLFHRTDYNEKYWTDYLAARPEYSQDFYEFICDYHREQYGQWALAHDVGTGPGQVAAQLTKYFDRVIASDNNESHLTVALHRLGPLATTGHDQVSARVHLTQSTAEALAANFPANSADLVTAAECLPLLDADKALASFHTLLKPRGTLAIWFYGRPIFAEPAYAPRCQPLYDAIVDRAYAKVIKGGGPQHKAGWTRATQTLISFLDNIDLTSSDRWLDVRRVKWNPRHEMCFYGPYACDFEVAKVSRIDTDKESLWEFEDLTFWERRWDVHGVRRFVTALLPHFGDERFKVEGIEEMYAELARAMGGEGVARKITWPVALILATKG